MEKLTNTYSRCTLTNVNPEHPVHGPFIISQEAYDPEDPRFTATLFLLRSDGVWIDELAVEQLPEEDQLLIFHESVESAARMLRALDGEPEIERHRLTAQDLRAMIAGWKNGGFSVRAHSLALRYRELQRVKQR